MLYRKKICNLLKTPVYADSHLQWSHTLTYVNLYLRTLRAIMLKITMLLTDTIDDEILPVE